MPNEIKDLLERAGWTGVEAFLAGLTISAIFTSGISVVITAVIAAGAAVLSAVKSYVKTKVAALPTN